MLWSPQVAAQDEEQAEKEGAAVQLSAQKGDEEHARRCTSSGRPCSMGAAWWKCIVVMWSLGRHKRAGQARASEQGHWEGQGLSDSAPQPSRLR